ncbi:hypothetical protein C7S14_7851 [Burkholderia cepacia]|nr:hypothetical protein C7S14_7851 [Burkholderia cepacia]
MARQTPPRRRALHIGAIVDSHVTDGAAPDHEWRPRFAAHRCGTIGGCAPKAAYLAWGVGQCRRRGNLGAQDGPDFRRRG